VEACKSATRLDAGGLNMSAQQDICSLQLSSRQFVGNKAAAGQSGGSNLYITNPSLWRKSAAAADQKFHKQQQQRQQHRLPSDLEGTASWPAALRLSVKNRGPSNLCGTAVSRNSSSTNDLLQGATRGGCGVDNFTLDASGLLPPMTVTVVDHMGQLLASTVAQKLAVELECQALTPNSSCRVAGVTRQTPWNSSAGFESIKLFGQPGQQYRISFVLRLPSQQTTGQQGNSSTLLLSTPGCSAGQAITGSGCYNCSNPYYSFGPPSGKICFYWPP
jgi:hypothetical protein